MKPTTLMLLLFFLAANGGAVAHPGPGESTLNPAAELLQGRTGALALALVRDGRPARTWFAGVRGEGPRSVDERTLFRACSLSKPVFAYLVLRLTEEGVLKLDQPLFADGRNITDLPDYRDLASDGRLKKLTPRLLLTHRGGLPNWRWLRPNGRLAFDAEPGSTFSYSGEGYRLLQEDVERRCDGNLDELCRRRVFDPLRMNDSRFLPNEESIERLSFDLAAIPPRFQEMIKRERNAAGSLLTTVGDFARFLQAVMSSRGLQPQTVAEMLRPQVPITRKALFGPAAGEGGKNANGLSWCLGWIYCRGPLGEAYFHVGAEEGFESFMAFFPAKRTGLVVLSSGATDGVVSDALASFFGETGIPLAWMGYPAGRRGQMKGAR